MYPRIDSIKTGQNLKNLLTEAGYDVKYIQRYLNLSCPQSVYRWFKGKILPSVEHLCALSLLLNMHMEELLVFQRSCVYVPYEVIVDCVEDADKRIARIHNCFRRAYMT